jgi:methylenetetrahydrofolate reductase (NADPH)
LPHGAAVAGRAAFFIGGADVPIDPPPGWRPDALAAKVAAGAAFVQTQFCMDTGVVRRYAARLAEAGLAGRVFVIIGVNPLRSVRSAAWMRHHLFGTIIPDAMVARMEAAADPAAEGRRICIEVIEELATIPGIAGAHIMAPGNAAAIPDVIEAVRSKVAAARAD